MNLWPRLFSSLRERRACARLRGQDAAPPVPPRPAPGQAWEVARDLRLDGESLTRIVELAGHDTSSAWSALSSALRTDSTCEEADLTAAVANPLLWELSRSRVTWGTEVCRVLSADNARVIAEWSSRHGIARRDDALDVLFILEHLVGYHSEVLPTAAEQLLEWCRTLGFDASTPWPAVTAAVLRETNPRPSVYAALWRTSAVTHADLVVALLNAGATASVAELDELARQV